MEVNLYFVYGILPNGDTTEKRVTDLLHLRHCADMLKAQCGVSKAHYNVADMCFDGYLVQGEYCGTL